MDVGDDEQVRQDVIAQGELLLAGFVKCPGCKDRGRSTWTSGGLQLVCAHCGGDGVVRKVLASVR